MVFLYKKRVVKVRSNVRPNVRSVAQGLRYALVEIKAMHITTTFRQHAKTKSTPSFFLSKRTKTY